MDWIFQIKFVGLLGHAGAVSVVGGDGFSLTFSKVKRRFLGEQVVFIKTCFDQEKPQEKQKNMLDHVKREKMSSTETEIIGYGWCCKKKQNLTF